MGPILEINGLVLVESKLLVAVVEELRSTLNVEEPKIPGDPLLFYWERYAMDGNGTHVGYEKWEVRVPQIRAGFLGWLNTPRSCWGEYLVALKSDDCQIHLADYPDDNYDEDGDVGGVFDDRYYRPDDDFGWSEFDHWLDTALDVIRQGSREFTASSREWGFRLRDGFLIPMGKLGE